LFAHRCLPRSLKRIVYIDPDTLILNRLDALMELNLQGMWFAAAYHDIAPRTLNQMRLYPYAMQQYYNSGVLVMDLEAQRRHLQVQEILRFVQINKNRLVMPDQDILNALYAARIFTLDERRYNYDARYFNYYRLKSGGEWDMERVLKDCSILHFCGKRKPWQASYRGKFDALYRYVAKQALNLEATLERL
jgi:lipopolysaccharide biosynthesis glycosyltransferase